MVVPGRRKESKAEIARKIIASLPPADSPFSTNGMFKKAVKAHQIMTSLKETPSPPTTSEREERARAARRVVKTLSKASINSDGMSSSCKRSYQGQGRRMVGDEVEDEEDLYMPEPVQPAVKSRATAAWLMNSTVEADEEEEEEEDDEEDVYEGQLLATNLDAEEEGSGEVDGEMGRHGRGGYGRDFSNGRVEDSRGGRYFDLDEEEECESGLGDVLSDSEILDGALVREDEMEESDDDGDDDQGGLRPAGGMPMRGRGMGGERVAQEGGAVLMASALGTPPMPHAFGTAAYHESQVTTYSMHHHLPMHPNAYPTAAPVPVAAVATPSHQHASAFSSTPRIPNGSSSSSQSQGANVYRRQVSFSQDVVAHTPSSNPARGGGHAAPVASHSHTPRAAIPVAVASGGMEDIAAAAAHHGSKSSRGHSAPTPTARALQALPPTHFSRSKSEILPHADKREAFLRSSTMPLGVAPHYPPPSAAHAGMAVGSEEHGGRGERHGRGAETPRQMAAAAAAAAVAAVAAQKEERQQERRQRQQQQPLPPMSGRSASGKGQEMYTYYEGLREESRKPMRVGSDSMSVISGFSNSSASSFGSVRSSSSARSVSSSKSAPVSGSMQRSETFTASHKHSTLTAGEDRAPPRLSAAAPHKAVPEIRRSQTLMSHEKKTSSTTTSSSGSSSNRVSSTPRSSSSRVTQSTTEAKPALSRSLTNTNESQPSLARSMSQVGPKKAGAGDSSVSRSHVVEYSKSKSLPKGLQKSASMQRPKAHATQTNVQRVYVS